MCAVCSMLTLQTPTPQNGQTHLNDNDELFECV